MIDIAGLRSVATRKECAKAERIAQQEHIEFEQALLRLFTQAAGRRPLPEWIERRKRRIERETERQRVEQEKEARTWKAWFDGAAEPNPGQRGIGGLLVSPSGERIEISRAIGHGTNNEAEYEALIAVLEAAIEVGASPLRIHGDSQLVISQVTGEWDCRSDRLYGLMHKAQSLLSRLDGAHLQWIPREQNKEADALSVKAIDGVDRSVWVNQTQIGKSLGLSAVAVGRLLDDLRLRDGRFPTRLALDLGIGRVVENHFGRQVFWHLGKTVTALQEHVDRQDSLPGKDGI